MTFVNDTRAIIKKRQRDAKATRIEMLLIAALFIVSLAVMLPYLNKHYAEQDVINQEWNMRGSL